MELIIIESNMLRETRGGEGLGEGVIRQSLVIRLFRQLIELVIRACAERRLNWFC